MDPQTFTKNSPFSLAHGDQYNLSNTSPELLKFQLLEQSRAPQQIQPLDSKFTAHLQHTITNSLINLDSDEDSEKDEFSHAGSPESPNSSTSDFPLMDTTPSNLKVLIENSLFDSAAILHLAILPLKKVNRLKALIKHNEDVKLYLLEKIAVSNDFCTLLLTKQDGQHDAELLAKILKQNLDLQQRLRQILQDLDDLTKLLNNHNLACLHLGYVEDVKHLHPGDVSVRLVDPLSRLFDSLFSHIASLAAQNNVTLPRHPAESETSLQARVEWAQDCIDAIVGLKAVSTPPTSAGPETDKSVDYLVSEDNSMLQEHSFLSASPYKGYGKPGVLEQKTISEYKLALTDLRFSHQYFMKEYAYLKENSLKTISEYRKKNALLEKQLAKQNGAVPAESLEAKDQEIARLWKELNLLKIDNLGAKSGNTSGLLSPLLLSGNGNSDEDGTDYIQLQASPSLYKSYGATSTSNAILRKEFKKIVAEIQDHYEVELGKERLRARQLEAQARQQ